MTISAFLPVFNEEKRITDTLDSLMWCDEIILVDKNSTDRTVEIASSYGEKIKVCTMNNSERYDASEWTVFLDNCTSEWTILFTASDVIHPKLVDKITRLLKNQGGTFEIMHIPFKRYVLGLDFKNSPWHAELSPKIVKKSAIIINEDGVHGAAGFVGNNYFIEKSDDYCMYHLTHETVDIMMDRHLRYWRGEANEKNINLRSSITKSIKSLIRLTFFKRIPLKGYDGFAILFSFLTYQMMSYVYKWEKQKGLAPQVYSEIKKNIKLEWESYGR